MLAYVSWGLLTSNQDHSVTRLGFDHLLRVHAHQVAQVHACGRGKGFMDADGGKIHGQSATQLHTSLYSIDKLRYVGVTGVEA